MDKVKDINKRLENNDTDFSSYELGQLQEAKSRIDTVHGMLHVIFEIIVNNNRKLGGTVERHIQRYNTSAERYGYDKIQSFSDESVYNKITHDKFMSEERVKFERIKENLKSQSDILEKSISEKNLKKKQADEQLFPKSVEKVNKSENKSKLANPIKEEVKKYVKFSDLPLEVLKAFQTIMPNLITEITALREPIPKEQWGWNSAHRYRLQNQYNNLAKINNLEELDVRHGDFTAIDNALETLKSQQDTITQKSKSGFFHKLGNAIVNFFTKTLPSIFMHPKEEKNPAELQVNKQNKSTVATTMEKLAGNKAKNFLENRTSIKEPEDKTKLANPTEGELKKYANFSDLPLEALKAFQTIMPNLITEINALREPIPKEQWGWNSAHRYRLQNQYNNLAKVNNLEELDVRHGDFTAIDNALETLKSQQDTITEKSTLDTSTQKSNSGFSHKLGNGYR